MNTKINNLSVFTDGDKNKKSIVFVHGFPFDHYMWDEQVKALNGSEDRFSPPAAMKSMANEIPGSEFVLVEGAGHMAPVEKTDFVNEKIAGFLKRMNS